MSKLDAQRKSKTVSMSQEAYDRLIRDSLAVNFAIRELSMSNGKPIDAAKLLHGIYGLISKSH